MAEQAVSGQLVCVQCDSRFEWPARKSGPVKRFCPECVKANNRKRVVEHFARKRATDQRAKRRQGTEDHRLCLLRAIRRFVVNPKLQCLECGAEMMRPEPRGDRCGPCARSRDAAILRSCRSARKRYLRKFKFDPVAVFERDGWRCYLCGVATPRELRGSKSDNAPELEHIVPISRGGEHSEANTACACRRCNSDKRAKTVEEFMVWREKQAA